MIESLDQSPNEEMGERIAESSPISFLPRLVMVRDLMKSMSSHRDRVDEGNQAMARAAGMEDIVTNTKKSNTDDEMHDESITITGDQKNVHHHYPSKSNSSVPSGLGKAALAAALLGSGLAGGTLLTKYLNEKVQTPTNEEFKDTTNQYEFGLGYPKEEKK